MSLRALGYCALFSAFLWAWITLAGLVVWAVIS